MQTLLSLPQNLAHGVYYAYNAPAGISWQMRLVTALLPAMFSKNLLVGMSEEDTYERCMERSKMMPEVPSPPQGVKISDATSSFESLTSSSKGEWQFYVISPESDIHSSPSPFILYLHGGAYIATAQKSHFSFLYDICQQTGATILLPAYPRPPNAGVTYKDTFEVLFKLSESLRGNRARESSQDGQDIFDQARNASKYVIAGDSAGGGLAFAFTMALLQQGKKDQIPHDLILNAPWLDVSLSSPGLDYYDRIDPWLALPLVRIAGRMWAGGNEDIKSTLVSPIMLPDAELEKLRDSGIRLSIFQGEADLTCCDTSALVKRLTSLEVKYDYHFKKGVPHVYPLFPPFVPEAREARKAIVDIIRRA